MTREEAIGKWINPAISTMWNEKKCKEILKALEQEPCEDCISRQAVLDLVDSYSESQSNVEDVTQDIISDIVVLPPVNPQPKTGYWILADEQNKEDVENDNYRFICSECQYSDIHAKDTIVPYCWKCGTRMVEPQESEETNADSN